jgi:hypothetical protein
MTEPAPVPDDELVSAYLDDAVDAADRARVENTPELLAQADRLAGIRNAVATSRPVPDPRQRDEHIANALAEAAGVIDLAERRERRTRRFAVLSAAAAVLVVAGVLALIAGRNDHDTSTAGKSVAATTAPSAAGAPSALAAPTTPADAAGASSDRAASTTPAAEAATTTVAAGATTTPASRPVAAPSSTADLGTIDAESAPAVLRGARDRRPPAPAACALPSGTHYVGTAIYEGTSVYAFVTDSSASAIVVDRLTCVVVADVPLT